MQLLFLNLGKINKVQDIKSLFTNFKAFDVQDKELANNLNRNLDELYKPGTCILNIIWICDSLPSSLSPELFGVLDRAISYHNAKLTVIPNLSTENSKSCAWQDALNAEVHNNSNKSMVGLFEPSLVWRGGMLIAETPEQDEILEDLEIHIDEDSLDKILKKIKLRNLHSQILTKGEERTECYFDNNLELVCEVDPLTVPATYLTPHHFTILTKNTEVNDIERTFFEEGFTSSRVGYIVRLRVAEKLPKDYEKRTEENWKKRVIEDTVGYIENNHLTECGSYVYFLLFSDNINNEKMEKSMILLHHLNYKDARLKMKYTPRLEIVYPRLIESAKEINLSCDVRMMDFYQYRRNIVAAILNKMLENKTETLITQPVEEILLGVEQSVNDTMDMLIDVHREVMTKLPKITPAIMANPYSTRRLKLTSNYCEDITEKQFLKLFSKKQDNLDSSQESEQEISKMDTISLEASEILKFFTANGSPAKHLDLEPITLGNKCSAYLTEAEYIAVFQENFNLFAPDRAVMVDKHRKRKGPRDLKYIGYKFIGEDFRGFEFKKGPNVFYNNGPAAEKTDRDYGRMRDVYVGMIKETATSLDVNKAPEKLKLKQSPAASKVLRRSPRKKSLGSKRLDIKPSRASDLMSRKRSADLGSGVRPDLGISSRSKLITKRREMPQQKLVVSSDKEWGRKIRVAVICALKSRKIDEKNPLFRRCFGTLVKMCQIAVPDRSVMNASDLLLNVAMSNADNIIKAEYMKIKSAR